MSENIDALFLIGNGVSTFLLDPFHIGTGASMNINALFLVENDASTDIVVISHSY